MNPRDEWHHWPTFGLNFLHTGQIHDFGISVNRLTSVRNVRRVVSSLYGSIPTFFNRMRFAAMDFLEYSRCLAFSFWSVARTNARRLRALSRFRCTASACRRSRVFKRVISSCVRFKSRAVMLVFDIISGVHQKFEFQVCKTAFNLILRI